MSAHAAAARAPARAARPIAAAPGRARSPAGALLGRFGNAGTGALLADRSVVRPKLELGAVSDPLEREADATADKVVRMKAGGDCAACARGGPCTGGGATVRRASDAGGGEAAPLGAAAEASIRRATSGGEPLPGKVRAAMEPAFGADFSGVRVHRDAAAGDSARGIGARAYTVGSHIAFGAGQWAPGSDRGDHLIAHELTHTLQEGGPAARTVRGDFLDDLSDAAGAVVDQAEGAAAGLMDRAADAAHEAEEAVSSTVSAGAETVGAGADAVAEVAADVGEAASEVAADVGEAVAETADAVAGAPERLRSDLLDRVAGARTRLARVDPAARIAESPELGRLNDQIAHLGRVSPTFAEAQPIPAPAPPMPIGEFLAWLAAILAGAALWELVLIAVIVAAIIMLIMYLLQWLIDRPIEIPIDDPIDEPIEDDCFAQFGLEPGTNARRIEQRAPIDNVTTVDHAYFRLDGGKPAPPGQKASGRASRWARSIGCRFDDAGHVIARRFGGTTLFDEPEGNIYPQDSVFNRGSMNQTDRVIAQKHKAGCDVCTLIQLSYTPENSLRPTHAVYFFMFRNPGALRFSPLIPSVQRNESADPDCDA